MDNKLIAIYCKYWITTVAFFGLLVVLVFIFGCGSPRIVSSPCPILSVTPHPPGATVVFQCTPTTTQTVEEPVWPPPTDLLAPESHQ